MPFFARPDLSDEQFKQLVGSQLTLSGQTRIASTSGLTLTDGLGGYIPIIATGATNLDVLTYNSATNQITLQPSTGGGSGVYSGASPTTCTVGGLVAGSAIFNCSISTILEEILVPTLNPTLSAPFGTFTINPSSLLYEVGTSISITGTSALNRGTITPAYCGGPNMRSGVAKSYNYVIWGASPVPIVCSASTNTYSFCSHVITSGNNTLSNYIGYNCGEQPLNSAGGNYCSPLPSGYTTTNTYTICGMYPYYYGKVASGGAAAGVNRPSPTASLISGGTKVVASSTGTISVTFGSTSDDYIWFAIPTASTSKTKWCVDALNNGNIGGIVSAGGNLFPAENSVSGVGNTCWSGQTYKLYISNYQSSASSIMYLKNI